MKITKFLLLVVAVFAFSCSKDDDPGLEEKTLSLAGSSEVVVAPTAMQASQDPQAQQAVEWIASANAMTQYLGYLKAPAGASKSSERITASNGRVKTTGDVVVYTWHDDQSDYTIGYQISEASDSYVFEVFMKYPGQTEWLKYFHAEEKKDRSAGFMKVYDIFGILDQGNSAILLTYEWTHSGDIFTFTMTDGFGGSVIELTLNEKTKAGSVIYTTDGVKEYEMSWDAAGNGSWTLYDEEGNVSDSGEWTV